MKIKDETNNVGAGSVSAPKGINTRHNPFAHTKNATTGITLVSLVITVIVLLILAGITINLTIGEHGIINMAKQAGKNYMDAEQYERNQLNTLNQEFMNQVYGIGSYETSPQYSNFKQLIANAITAQGVETTTQDSEETIIENIDKILQARTKDATATADDIAEGKTAYVNGNKIIGTFTGKNDVINLNFTNVYVLNNRIFQCLDVRNYNILEIKLKTGARPTDGSKNSAPYTLGVYQLNEMFTGENATVEPYKNLIESYKIPTNTTEYLSYTIDISDIDYVGFTTTDNTAYVNFKISIK